MAYTFEIVGYIVSAIVMIYIFLHIYQLFAENDKIKRVIIEHYSNLGLRVTDIRKLNFTERLKYGVPISFMCIYSYFFGFLSGQIDYVRKVDIINDENEIIKYVELRVQKREVISFREIDSFEY